MPGSAIGRIIWKNAPHMDRPSTSAASSSSVGNRLELIAHDPDHDRQHGQRVKEDKPDPRVEEGEFPVEHEERQGQHHRRQDELGEEEEGNVRVPHEEEAVGKAGQGRRPPGAGGHPD
jgi:hypothetical protein